MRSEAAGDPQSMAVRNVQRNSSSRRVSLRDAPGDPPMPIQRMNTHRYIKGTTVEKPAPEHDGPALWAIACHPMNLLLIFLPLGTAAYFLKWDDVYVFWFNFFAMIPLAKILGDATEELAASLKNDMVAGLLNATFGNAVEMVITVKTLRAGLYDVVKSTLLGSVLSNTLLVLGMSFLCGGLVTLPERRQGPKPEEQPPPTGDYKGLLADQSDGDTASRGDSRQTTQGPADSLLAVTGEGKKDVPEANKDIREVVAEQNYFDQFDGAEKIQSFSVLGALVNTSMLLISCMSFSLITVFRQVSHVEGDAYMEEVLLPVSRIASIIIILAYVAYTVFQLVTHKDTMSADQGADEGDDGEDHMSVTTACMLLFGTTVIVSCCTEMLVTAIGGVTEHAHISKHFIGIILLPIVGNACEHASAVRFSIMDKPGLAVGIAVGSSTQIAMFVVPFSVMCGWAIGQPMDLDFGSLNTTVLMVSIIVVLSIIVDGQANWLQGYLLISAYAIIAVLYFWMPDTTSLRSE